MIIMALFVQIYKSCKVTSSSLPIGVLMALLVLSVMGCTIFVRGQNPVSGPQHVASPHLGLNVTVRQVIDYVLFTWIHNLYHALTSNYYWRRKTT